MEAHFNTPGLTRIQDLPSELLYEIFRRVEVEYEDDLDNLQEVCSRWYAIIDQWMGRIVSTSDEMVVHPSNPNLSKVGLDLISEIGVNYLHVKRRDGHLLEEPPSPLPSFKLPYLLKHLRLQGRIHPDVFKSLVKDTTNLTILDLSLAILHHLRKSDMKHLNFPRLTKFRVACKFSVEKNSEESLSLPNLQALLDDNVFPRLTRLRVDFPFSAVEGLKTIKALVGFVHVHPRLEKLFVWMKFPYASYNLLPPSDRFIPKDPLAYQEEVDAIISRVRSSGCRSVKSFRVAGLFTTRTYSHFEILKELAMRQTALQCLNLRIDNSLDYKGLKAICTRFGTTLLKLRIHGVISDDMDWEQFDCLVFSPLKVIRSLEVCYGWRPRDNGRPRYLDLPPTLKYLSLSGKLRSDEVAQILLELPNLRYIDLCFRHTGDRGMNDTPVGVDILQQFVQNRRVKGLRLNGFRMSNEFLEEGIPNGDPINPQRLIYGVWYRIEQTVSIDWELNNSGYYRMV